MTSRRRCVPQSGLNFRSRDQASVRLHTNREIALLAGLGIYAVVAFTVERRTRELGIRAVLGATRASLIRNVMRDSLRTVSLGLAVGLALAVLATRGLEGLLFGVPPLDFMTFAGASVLLLAAASIAAFLPARRAGSAHPADVLRTQ